MTQSKTRSSGKYFGGSAGVDVGFNMGAINLGFEVGINAGRNSGTADTAGKTNSTMRASQQSRAFTDTVSSTKRQEKACSLIMKTVL